MRNISPQPHHSKQQINKRRESPGFNEFAQKLKQRALTQTQKLKIQRRNFQIDFCLAFDLENLKKL